MSHKLQQIFVFIFLKYSSNIWDMLYRPIFCSIALRVAALLKLLFELANF